MGTLLSAQRRARRDHGRHAARDRGRRRPRARPRDRGRRPDARASRDRRSRHRLPQQGPAARPRQHASPLLPDADARGARGAGRGALRVAARAVPDVGPAHARDAQRLGERRDGGARAVRLYHRKRPPLSLPERRPPRRHHRRRARHGTALPRVPRRDDRRRIAGRAAARCAGRARGRRAARHTTRDRGVSRSLADSRCCGSPPRPARRSRSRRT